MTYKLLLCITIAVFSGIASANAQDKWPKQFTDADGAVITMYEPQPESISGNEMTGRAAVSIKKSGTAEPVFGAVMFTATLQNSRSSGTLSFDRFTVNRAKFSGLDDEAATDRIMQQLEEEAPGWNLGMTKNDIEEAAEREQRATSSEKFNNAAPDIIYASKPSTLIVLDGEPRIVYDKKLEADRVANSPNLIFKDKKQWNLYAGGVWYKSPVITGGWQPNNNPSSKVRSIHESIKKQEKENNRDNVQSAVPKATEIVVTTKPAELIQTDGAPEYKNVSGTSLLYVANSPNEIFKDINSQKTYILLAGRWYRAGNIEGPWEYVSADNLPDDFAKIPEGSDKDAVLANVAGTEAAEEAIMEAAIPQTAKVDRKTATVQVEYDGDPVFNRIDGTSLRLAENANTTVMLDSYGNYFALDNGIWFISDDAYGPWSVANDRPRDLDAIPASSPAYHTKYVYIYDVTPDYVYTGYTYGYLGSYIYGPTIVYGTGYHYRPWFRRVYYPRPITWGFGFMYDPWYGWNINWGFNYGFMHVGFDYGYWNYGYGGGWFGPHRYCPGYRYPYWTGGYYGRYGARRDYYYARNNYPRTYYGTNNVYNNQQGVVTRDVNRTTRAYRPGDNATFAARNNRVYNDRMPANRTSSNRSFTPSLNNNTRAGGERNANVDNRLYRNDNRRAPVIHNPGNVNGNNDGNNDNNNDRVNRSGERPRTIVRDNDNVRTPQINRNDERAERRPVTPRYGERATPPVSRPAPAERPSVPVQREQYNRPSSPAPRQQYERPSAPVQRPQFDRPSSAPQRPSYTPPVSSPRSSGGGGSQRPVGIDRGRRPDNR